MAKTQIWAANTKTQFYGPDGTGRDTYISLHNGGFCPPTEPTKIEELGKISPAFRKILILFTLLTIGTFYYSKQRPRDHLPVIHSKGVNYTNNGGGRDTYISDSAGGLRNLYQPAAFKRTFYNNLRVYDQSPSPIKGPSRTKYNSSLNTCGGVAFNRSRSSLKGGATSPPLT